jgi:hypothetical protein
MDFPEQSRSTPIDLSSPRVSNLIVLLIIMWELLEVCDGVLGVRGHACLIALTLGWLSQPAERIVEARHGSYAYCPVRDLWSTFVMFAGAAPWFIVGILYATHRSWPIWQPVPMPPLVRAAGAALALGLILSRPRWRGEPLRERAACAIPDLTVQSQLLVISMLLVSGSLVVVFFSLYWLVAIAISRLALRPPVAVAVPVGAP